MFWFFNIKVIIVEINLINLKLEAPVKLADGLLSWHLVNWNVEILIMGSVSFQKVEIE